jgi:hypothetical protein
MSRLKMLYLHGNQLSGPLPLDLQNMTQLHTLALSNNLLQGDDNKCTRDLFPVACWLLKCFNVHPLLPDSLPVISLSVLSH